MDTLKASILSLASVVVCICGCVSQPNDVVVVAALPPAPYSIFTRFPYYTYNQTAISDHIEFKGIPIDFLVVLSNYTSTPIAVPNCGKLWPNAVDIEMKIRNGTIHELKTTGVVSVRSTDEIATLVVPPGGSIAYPVVLDYRLFQNLPCLTLGDVFFIRATISWSRIAKNASSVAPSSTAMSKWLPLVYKSNTNDDQFSGQPSDNTSVPASVESPFKEDDDIELKVDITFDEDE